MQFNNVNVNIAFLNSKSNTNFIDVKKFFLIAFASIFVSCTNVDSSTDSIGPIYLWSSGETELVMGGTLISTENEDIMKITDVSAPSITVFPSNAHDPSPAVLIFPGGGYSLLAYDLEGTEIAHWLNSIGITAIIVKYSVPNKRKLAFKDAQRAQQIVRINARKWNIDSTKIGVIGFSAGAHLAARLLTSKITTDSYDSTKADSVGNIPSFGILVYPAYLEDEMLYSSNKALHPNSDFPPTLIVQTEDDHRFIVGTKLFYKTYKGANQDISMQLFREGGHGYGLRADPTWDVSSWPETAQKWLENKSIM